MKFNVRLKSVVFAALTFSAVTMLAPAHAGLKDAMNEMFIVSSTNPQAIETQRLRGIYGGSMTMRNASRPINIAQFGAPRIDAGCGGIDIFFGSFSFINGAQFEQLIRSIAANAVGFAVKAAITGMCAPCAGILSDLEDAVRELNSLAKNSCAIMNSMFSGNEANKIQESARNIGKSISSAANKVSDWAAGENRSQAETVKETASSNNSAEGRNNNPLIGNMVHRAAKETYARGANTLRAFLTEAETIQFVTALFGTTIYPTTQSGETCGSGVNAERCENPPRLYGPTIATWDQLFKPRQHSQNGLTVWQCASSNSECTEISAVSVSLAQWGGVEDAINVALFGVADSANRSAWTSTSLVGSFVHKNPITDNGSNLNAQARNLLSTLPFPLLTMLMEVQHIPGAAETLGILVSKHLPDYYAYQLGVDLMGVAQSTFTGQVKAEAPEHFREEINRKGLMLNNLRPTAKDLSEMVSSAYQSILISQKLVSPRVMNSSAAGGN